MADLKIQQLQQVEPLTGSSKMDDRDLLLVKMKQRGTAQGDEDRNITWKDLVSNLNLGRFLPTAGGTVTGDLYLNNNVPLRSKTKGGSTPGASRRLISMTSNDVIQVGDASQPFQTLANNDPTLKVGTTSTEFKFYTEHYRPGPHDLGSGSTNNTNKDNAYTQKEVDDALTLKMNVSGGTFNGDVTLAAGKSIKSLVTGQSTPQNVWSYSASEGQVFGTVTYPFSVHASTDPTLKIGTTATAYKFYTEHFRPNPGDLGSGSNAKDSAYNRTDVDTLLTKKLDLTGGSMTGNIVFKKATPATTGTGAKPEVVAGIFGIDQAGVQTRLLTLDSLDNQVLGSTSHKLQINTSANPVVRVGSTNYTMYHTGNKPTSGDVGAYSKAEADARYLKLDGTNTMTADVLTKNGEGLVSYKKDGTTKVTLAIVDATDVSYLGSPSVPTILRSSTKLQTTTGQGTPVDVYTENNKPVPADIGAAAVSSTGTNSDIKQITGLTTALSIAQGGTGAKTGFDAAAALNVYGYLSIPSHTDSDGSTGYVKVASLPATVNNQNNPNVQLMITGAGDYGGKQGFAFVSCNIRAVSGATLQDVTSANIANVLSHYGFGDSSGDTKVGIETVKNASGTITAYNLYIELKAYTSGARVTFLTPPNVGISYVSSLTKTKTKPAVYATAPVSNIYTDLSKPSLAPLGAAARGNNSDITQLSGLTTALSIAQGGTGAKDRTNAEMNLNVVSKGGGDVTRKLTVDSDVDLFKQLRALGSTVFRASENTGKSWSGATHGASLYMHVNDTHAVLNVAYNNGVVKVLAGTDATVATAPVVNTLYGTANKPSAGDVGAYSKAEVDSRLGGKASLGGATFTGGVNVPSAKGLKTVPASSGNADTSKTSAAISGENGWALLWRIADNTGVTNPNRKDEFIGISPDTPKIIYRRTKADKSGTEDCEIFHTKRVPTAAELGFTTDLDRANKAVQYDEFLFGKTSGPDMIPDSGFLTKTHLQTLLFTQDGSATAKRFGGLGTGIHIFYGQNANKTQDLSSSLFIRQDGVVTAKWSVSPSTGTATDANTQTINNTLYGTANKPTAADVGAYSKAEADSRYNGKANLSGATFTGAVKGIDATDDKGFITLSQLKTATSATAGAVVGVVGGFLGAVQWFNGDRNHIPAGWVAADGQSLNRVDYPELWASVSAGALPSVTEALWKSAGGTDKRMLHKHRGKYSQGDGSKTFRVPDLNGGQTDSVPGLFLRGRAPTFTFKEGEITMSALPDLTGDVGTAGTGVFKGASGVFKAVANQGNGVQPGTAEPTGSILHFSAAGASSVADPNGIYGASVTEITPSAAYGIWIIRVNNNFEATNSQFSVNNGLGKAPAANTSMNAGSLRSVFSIGGNESHSTELLASRAYGKDAAAILRVAQSNQTSASTAQSYDFSFGADGAFQSDALRAQGIGLGKRTDSTTPGPFINIYSAGNVDAEGNMSFGDAKNKDWTFTINKGNGVLNVSAEMKVSKGVQASYMKSTGDMVCQNTLWSYGNDFIRKESDAVNGTDHNCNMIRGVIKNTDLTADVALHEIRGTRHEYIVHLYGASADTWSKIRSDGVFENSTNRGDGYVSWWFGNKGVNIAPDGNLKGSIWQRNGGDGWIASYLDNNFAPKSDLRVKTNVSEVSLERAKEFIKSVKTYEFNYDLSGNKDRSAGYMAQDVEDFDKELVNTLPSSMKKSDGSLVEDVKSIDSGNIAAAMLTPVVRDLMEQIEILKARLDALEAK